MPKLPVLSAKQVIKALERMGFKIVRQSGSHIHLWSDQRRILVTVPNHKELAKGTLNGIIKQTKLDRDEVLSYVK